MPSRAPAALILLALCAAPALAVDLALEGSRSRTQTAIGDYDRHVAGLNAAFERVPADARDKKWVAMKLRHMAEVDAYQRTFNIQTPERLQLTEAEKNEFRSQLGARAQAIDVSNRADLKKLLEIYPWFKISEFGEQADKDAWYLVQHADADPAFQAAVLDVLKGMAAAKETNRKNYAFLYDRVAISYDKPANRKPQRYGTQGECRGPRDWQVILPVEDMRNLDARRKEMDLGPHADYKKLIEEKLCR